MNLSEIQEFIESSFNEHTSKLTEYGNIKILDFQKGNLFEHRIRFLFEEDFFRLHISGDFGELTACNYKNMTFAHFHDHFCDNIGYFMEKVECMSREMYIYDSEDARKDLIEHLFDEEEVGRKEEDLSEEEQEILEEIIGFFSDDYGFNHTNMYENIPYCLVEMDCNYWEWIGSCGRRHNPVIALYLELFKVAKSRLEKESVTV